uniref:Uncharacterized protein n=1 Tax=Rhizophora mucronata TaxID=61149 RepID=A0A2P2PNM1_RHIMU
MLAIVSLFMHLPVSVYKREFMISIRHSIQ